MAFLDQDGGDLSRAIPKPINPDIELGDPTDRIPAPEPIFPESDQENLTKTIRKNPGANIARKSFFERAEDTAVNIVDKVTSAPEAINRVADNLRESLIGLSEGVQTRSEQKARENLSRSTITSYFSRFGRWVQKPTGAAVSGAVALVILVLIFRR